MNAELREKILDEIMEEVMRTKGKESERSKKLVDAYFNSISEDISVAIGNIDDMSAPFIVAALEMYAERIRGNFPKISKTVKWIKKLPSISVTKRHR